MKFVKKSSTEGIIVTTKKFGLGRIFLKLSRGYSYSYAIFNSKNGKLQEYYYLSEIFPNSGFYFCQEEHNSPLEILDVISGKVDITAKPKQIGPLVFSRTENSGSLQVNYVNDKRGFAFEKPVILHSLFIKNFIFFPNKLVVFLDQKSTLKYYNLEEEKVSESNLISNSPELEHSGIGIYKNEHLIVIKAPVAMEGENSRTNIEYTSISRLSNEIFHPDAFLFGFKLNSNNANYTGEEYAYRAYLYSINTKVIDNNNKKKLNDEIKKLGNISISDIAEMPNTYFLAGPDGNIWNLTVGVPLLEGIDCIEANNMSLKDRLHPKTIFLPRRYLEFQLLKYNNSLRTPKSFKLFFGVIAGVGVGVKISKEDEFSENLETFNSYFIIVNKEKCGKIKISNGKVLNAAMQSDFILLITHKVIKMGDGQRRQVKQVEIWSYTGRDSFKKVTTFNLPAETLSNVRIISFSRREIVLSSANNILTFQVNLTFQHIKSIELNKLPWHLYPEGDLDFLGLRITLKKFYDDVNQCSAQDELLGKIPDLLDLVAFLGKEDFYYMNTPFNFGYLKKMANEIRSKYNKELFYIQWYFRSKPDLGYEVDIDLGLINYELKNEKFEKKLEKSEKKISFEKIKFISAAQENRSESDSNFEEEKYENNDGEEVVIEKNNLIKLKL